MNQLSMKFQIFTTLCMSQTDFSETDLLATMEQMYNYITDGIDMEDEHNDNVTRMFDTVQ